MDGCKKNCAQLVHKLSVIDILKFHEMYTTSVKKQWLLDYFAMNSSGPEIFYSICGKSVCFEVWLSVLGISQSYYYKVKSLFKDGVVKLNSEV